MSFFSNLFSRNSSSSTSTTPLSCPQTISEPALRTATFHKSRGNASFSQGDFTTALTEYSKAIAAFTNTSTKTTVNVPAGAPLLTPQDLPTLTDPKPALAALLSNKSATNLKLGHLDQALSDADWCIVMRPDWVKSHFRRGEALLELGRNSEASASFNKALELAPKDKRVAERKFYADTLTACEKCGVGIHSLFPGKGDFCKGGLNPINKLIGQFACELRNFVHVIVDLTSKEAVVVDPCWDSDGVLRLMKKHGWKLVGIVSTHSHLDHCGGIPPPPFNSYGIRVPGVASLLKKLPNIKCYIHPADLPQLFEHNPELSSQQTRFILTSDGSTLDCLPRLSTRFLHTPGHTPGSQSLFIEPGPDAPPLLFSGDLLFPGSCGRMDFPESDPDTLFSTLEHRLNGLPDSTAVFPGHDYGGEVLRLGNERETGVVGTAGLVRLKQQLAEEAVLAAQMGQQNGQGQGQGR